MSGDRRLWFAVAAAPAAWTIDALTAIALHNDFCAYRHDSGGGSSAGIGLMLTVIGVVAASVASLGGLAAWRRVRAAGPDDGLGDTEADRRRFMARFAMVISVLCFFGILLRTITVLFVSPGAC